jgi:hypothetical protein
VAIFQKALQGRVFVDTVGAGADEDVFSFDLIVHRLLDS